MLELHLQTFDIVRVYGGYTFGIFHRLFVSLFFLLRRLFLGIFSDELFDPAC